MTTKSKIIVVKIGTDVITTEDGLIDTDRIGAIVDQLAGINEKAQVVLVTSGSIGAGAALTQIQNFESEVARRQVLSAVGQIELIQIYRKAFARHNVISAQILTTKEDFGSRTHYLNMRRCFVNLLSHGVVPIVNENDAVSVSELMFTDNDELAGLIATMLDVNELFLLTGVDGVYEDFETKKILKQVIVGKTPWRQFVAPTTSSFGRGGMTTKCEIGEKLARLGIETIIANGKKDNILGALFASKQTPATRFIPQKKASQVKKWIAYAKGQERGSVSINQGAIDMLNSKDKVASLLPVGIVEMTGSFEKGDIIEIQDEHGQKLGLGKAQYSSKTAKDLIGKKGEKALVHYDYLYLE